MTSINWTYILLIKVGQCHSIKNTLFGFMQLNERSSYLTMHGWAFFFLSFICFRICICTLATKKAKERSLCYLDYNYTCKMSFLKLLFLQQKYIMIKKAPLNKAFLRLLKNVMYITGFDMLISFGLLTHFNWHYHSFHLSIILEPKCVS